MYDEEASRALHMNVVHEVVEREPMSLNLWVEAMGSLNVIDDPLIRKILAVHLDCGSGTGACDGMEPEVVPIGGARRLGLPHHGTRRGALRYRVPDGLGPRLRLSPPSH